MCIFRIKIMSNRNESRIKIILFQKKKILQYFLALLLLKTFLVIL